MSRPINDRHKFFVVNLLFTLYLHSSRVIFHINISIFVREVTHKNYKVTLLVNNAGVMFVPETYSKDGYEMHFAAVSLNQFHNFTASCINVIRFDKKKDCLFLFSSSSTNKTKQNKTKFIIHLYQMFSIK
jgi:hypothetical protein